jgi:hypothetical protein
VSWEELVLDGVHAVKMIWKPCFSKMFFKENGYNNLFSFGKTRKNSKEPFK